MIAEVKANRLSFRPRGPGDQATSVEIGRESPMADEEYTPYPVAGVSCKAVLALMKEDGTLLRELATLALEDMRSLMAEVRSAVAGSDFKRLQRAAQALKGHLGFFGAQSAFDAAEALELVAKRCSADAIGQVSAALESELHSVRSALEFLARQELACAS